MSMVKLLEDTVDPAVTAGAYSAADVVGGLLTFDLNSPSGVLLVKQLRIVDDANQKAAAHLYLFNAAPSDIADNAAYAPTVADLKKMVANITIAAADYTTLNSNAVALVDDRSGIDGGMCTTVNGRLYGYLVCDATPTYGATTDISITLSVLSE